MNAPLHLSRRRVLQGSLAAGASAALLPTWLAEMAGAAPLGANDGVVVLVQLGGGNDGLNTVVPFGDSAYYASATGSRSRRRTC